MRFGVIWISIFMRILAAVLLHSTMTTEAIVASSHSVALSETSDGKGFIHKTSRLSGDLLSAVCC